MITLKAENRRKAIINGRNVGDELPLFILAADFWQLEGVVFQGSRASGLVISGNCNRVTDCEACDNGDTGILKSINEFAETAEVEFEDGRIAEYAFKQLEDLELSYAVTIHKSQGSEYPAVVIPLLTGPKMLMNRNLLYTAVTRARRCVTIVGSENAFAEMIRNEQQQTRYSSLDLRIRELCGEED